MKRKNFWHILIILVATVIASRDLFKPGYFPMHDDLQVGRLYEMELCFLDRQIPCRWVPDLGYSYGYPLFNYYPPFPYYLGMIFRFLGFSFVDSVKILFILGFLASTIFMYLLGKELWGEDGGLVSAILYLFVPYHSVDVYVRGAMNEFWAMAFLPGIFWSALLIVKEENNRNFRLWLSLFFSLLLLSHNLMTFLFAPAVTFFVLILVFFWKKNFFKKLIDFFLSGIFGLGLAAFFTLPVIFEKKYVHIETMLMGYFNYLAHYVPISKMLFTRFWGYGSSGWLQDAGMPFQVGFPHWPLAVLTFFSACILFFRKKIKFQDFIVFPFYFFLFTFSLFMVHLRSVFIWKILPLLSYLQFPWRFLTIVAFSASVLGGGIIFLLKSKRHQVFLSTSLMVLIVVLNFSFFRAEKIIKITDGEKLFSAKGWNKLQTDAIFDYLPIYAKAPPASPAPEKPEIETGEAQILEVMKGTDWYNFKTKVIQEARIQIPIYDFPGWKVWVNGELTRTTHDNHLGLITVNLLPGEYFIRAKLTNTPIRWIGNIVSLVSWLMLLILFKKVK